MVYMASSRDGYRTVRLGDVGLSVGETRMLKALCLLEAAVVLVSVLMDAAIRHTSRHPT